MIKDLAAYHRLRVDEERKALVSMDLEASIAMAEALLTSAIMDRRGPRHGPRPRSLARALGISPARFDRRALPGR